MSLSITPSAAQLISEEVQIARAGRRAAPLNAYLARPAEAGESPQPGVVIVHELFGLNDNIRDIARRFAGEGYAALAVDLFSGSTHQRLCVMRVMAALALRPLRNAGLGDLRQAVAWLRQLPRVDAERIGAIGFCMGGGYALALACVEGPRRLRASSVFYCLNPRPLSAVARACPIVGSYPGEDWSARSGRKLEAALERYAVPHDVKIYPGAQHSFFNDTLESHNPAAAADAWQRTLRFFEEQMGAEAAS
jgi:carboxymethylenebutenolidase